LYAVFSMQSLMLFAAILVVIAATLYRRPGRGE